MTKATLNTAPDIEPYSYKNELLTLCRAAFAHMPYANLERPDTRDFARDDPAGFLLQFARTGAVLDEVQRVPELLSWQACTRSSACCAHPWRDACSSLAARAGMRAGGWRWWACGTEGPAQPRPTSPGAPRPAPAPPPCRHTALAGAMRGSEPTLWRTNSMSTPDKRDVLGTPMLGLLAG